MLLNCPVRQRLWSHGNMALYKFCIVLYCTRDLLIAGPTPNPMRHHATHHFRYIQQKVAVWFSGGASQPSSSTSGRSVLRGIAVYTGGPRIKNYAPNIPDYIHAESSTLIHRGDESGEQKFQCA